MTPAATVCPDCLTKDLECIVVTWGDPCRRCETIPKTRLTPGEIRTCLKLKTTK
jgi:hypothetical protein